MAAPDWKGLFEWSMKYQDGTKAGAATEMKPEDRAWFEEAMQHYTVDVAKRMTAIKAALDAEDKDLPEAEVHEREQLLEELMEIVENIDYARDLTKIGGLETLLGLLKSAHPSIRSRAAEVAATCVQINPPVQEWFMQGGALPKLMKLLEDSDATCRQKALLAISCLIRNNAAGLHAFLNAHGIAELAKLLQGDVPRVQRKALQLLTHISQEAPHELDATSLTPKLMQAGISDSQEGDVREAALNLLLQMTKDPATHAVLAKDSQLRGNLEDRIEQISRLEPEQREEADEESSQIVGILRSLKESSAPDNSRAQPNSANAAEQMPLRTEQLLLGPPT